VPALWLGQGAKRLRAVESIAQSGHRLRRHGLGLGAAPSLARLRCAVRLGLPVWRPEVLGGQGDAVGTAWAHEHGGDGGVRREGWTVRALPGEAVGALEGRGCKGGRASA